jgi:hypothetical protein
LNLGCDALLDITAPFLGKAGSMGTLIGLILLIWLIFVQPLETAKCKMMNAKCKSGRCAVLLIVEPWL